MWKEGQPPFCSCQAFIFGRNKIAKEEGIDQRKVLFFCKHLKQVIADTCDWAQTSEHDYQFNHQCPKCGGDLVDTDDGDMAPADPALLAHDLQVMLAEMEGKPPPPPPTRPTPHVVVFEVTTKYRVVIDALSPEAASTHVQDSLNSNNFYYRDEGGIDGETIQMVDAFVQDPNEKPAWSWGPESKPATPEVKATPMTATEVKDQSKKARTVAANLASTIRPAATRRR